MVPKRGLEPPRGCPRQPLKLVRLPFRHFRIYEGRVYRGGFAGVAGVAGGAAGVVGAGTARLGAGAPLTSEPGPRCPMIASASAPTMNSTARIAVALDNTVAPARAPNADWLLPPPNAAAMSPLPCCNRMTISSIRQMST